MLHTFWKENVIFIRKTAKYIVSEPPFGDSGVTYAIHP